MVKTGRFPRTGFDQGVHKPGDEKSTCVRVIKGHHAQSPTVIPQATTTSFFSDLSSRRHFRGLAQPPAAGVWFHTDGKCNTTQSFV